MSDTNFLPVSEAALLYTATSRTIQRKLKEIADKEHHPLRDQLKPSFNEWKQNEENETPSRYLATQKLLDSLGLTRQKGSAKGTVTAGVAKIQEEAEESTSRMISTNDLMREIIVKLEQELNDTKKELAEKNKQIERRDGELSEFRKSKNEEFKLFTETLREMTKTQRSTNGLIENMRQQLPEGRKRDGNANESVDATVVSDGQYTKSVSGQKTVSNKGPFRRIRSFVRLGKKR